MKITKDGVVCFLITMFPLNIIFTVRFLCEYLSERDVWFWISISILALLLVTGLIGCCFITKEDMKPSKHHTGEIYNVDCNI